MSLRERLVALAEQHDCDYDLGSSFNAERIALAAARMALEDAAKECGKGSLAQIGIRALRDGLE